MVIAAVIIIPICFFIGAFLFERPAVKFSLKWGLILAGIAVAFFAGIHFFGN